MDCSAITNEEERRRCMIIQNQDVHSLAEFFGTSPEMSHAGLASHLLRNFRVTHRPEEADLFAPTQEAPAPAPDVQIVDPKTEPFDPTLKFDPDEPQDAPKKK